MPSLASNVTTEEILASLKIYLRDRLQNEFKVARSVKTGLADMRDELPMIIVLPVLETVNTVYNGGMFQIDREFRVDLVDSAYTVEELKANLKKKFEFVRKCFSTEHLEWNLLNSQGEIQIFDYIGGKETWCEPTNIESGYTQYCSLPITLRSYTTVDSVNAPDSMFESTLPELLDYMFEKCKTFTAFSTFWKDVSKPISMNAFPALGVFIKDPEDDKQDVTSLDLENATVLFRIYSSLATKEIALINHLRNVETIKKWILSNPSLDGRAKDFSMFSVDYGLDIYSRPFQGGATEDWPVFRSDITTLASVMDFKDT